MRIQHNIAAMNSYRNYTANTNSLSKNLEKLSSGYKINRAGDDAAGLAISEKMRAQISGLKQATNNVKDGISLVKTAEGALQEVQDMMNRMVTLATQSANGTYDNDVDRNNLQKEVAALATEIDRIADSSNFNGTKLLDGSMGAAAVVGNEVAGGAAELSFTANTTNLDAAGLTDLKVEGTATTAGNITATYTAASTSKGTASITFNGKTFNIETGADNKLNGKKITIAVGASSVDATTAKEDGTGNVVITLAGDSTGLTAISTDSGLKNAIETALNTVKDSGGSSASALATEWAAVQVTVADGGSWGSAPTAGTDVGSTSNITGGGNVTRATITLTDKDSKTYTATAGADSGFANGDTLTFTPNNSGTLTITAKVADKTLITTGNINNTVFGATKIDGNDKPASVDLDFTGKTGASVIGASIEVDGVTYEFVKTGGNTTIENAVKVEVAEDATDANIAKALQEKLATHGKYEDNSTTAGKWDADLGTGDNAAKITLKTGAIGVNAKTPEIKQTGKGLTLQIGDTAESYNQLAVKVGDMHTKALGIDENSINVKTQDEAAKAIEKIKKAINTVSGTRGDLGAIQNRLEHTTNNLAIMTENIQDAESTIRDVDIADEMTTYTKNNILLQSAQAMLAQANQMPQGVLQLLQ